MKLKKITAMMVIGEESPYKLKETISHLEEYVEKIILVTTGENKQYSFGKNSLNKLKVISFQGTPFYGDNSLRKLCWEEVQKTNPDWILVIEPFQVLDNQIIKEINNLVQNDNIDVWAFRNEGYLDNYYDNQYDFSYVEDIMYWPRLIRNTDFYPEWIDTDLPFGWLPINVWKLRIGYSDIKIRQQGRENDHQETSRLHYYEKLLISNNVLSPQNLFNYANELYLSENYEMAIKIYKKFLLCKSKSASDKLIACFRLADSLEILGDSKEGIHTLFQSFHYDIPQPELCCAIGYYFMKNKEIRKAIYWYKLAIYLEMKENKNDHYVNNYLTWFPHFQLCICYYQIGNFNEALEYHDIARLLSNNILNKLFTLKSQARFRPLKIVQVAPDIYALPSNYGGIEKIVYDLTEELVNKGHEVYLFAPKGTISSGKLIPYEHKGTWKATEIVKHVKAFLPDQVDIIHDHTHYSSIGKENLSIPTVCSIHISSYNKVKHPVYVSELMLHTVGNSQGYQIPNGINLKEFQYSEEKKEYFLFLSRLSKQKGTHFALDICERANINLKIAGPISNNKEYMAEFEPRIRKNPNIEYVGTVEGQQKQELLKFSKCMLFPTNCNEAFGLVMIEAMACGTPVLALNNGAVSEVLNGFPELICDTVDEMLDKALNMTFPHPRLLREYIANNYSTNSMTEQYLELYKNIIHLEN